MTKPLNPNRRFYLREWRQAAELTQDQLAERLNTTKGMVSQLETGWQRYNEDWVTRAAGALDIEPHALFFAPGQVDLAALEDPQLSEITKTWQRLSPEHKNTLLSLAQTWAKP